MEKDKLVALLKLEDFSQIYTQANQVRQKNVGDTVHLRAILEYSSFCKRKCIYCGLNQTNKKLERYRLDENEIIQTAYQAFDAGYKTIVLQGGEDDYFNSERLGRIVLEIKKCGIDITLSSGERSFEDYAHLKNCGADRYLLKHETSDAAIYKQLHPDAELANRIRCLKEIKTLGYDTGSGFMIGLPNQTFETIAEDILLLKELKCDMAGIGPFISHPDTPLKNYPNGSGELTRRAVALTRLLMPTINLPATTSLSVLEGGGSKSIYDCGANVIMRKVTPTDKRRLYEIYPSMSRNTDIVSERKELEDFIVNCGRIPL